MIGELGAFLSEIISRMSAISINSIIIGILSLDTLRSVVASLGIVRREVPFWGRLIYGKYDVIIVKDVLRELGYAPQQADNIVKRLKNVAKQEGYPDADTALQLLYILSKYIIRFENAISYGLMSKGKSLSYSNYYINTMEAVHDTLDLRELAHIMIRLMKCHNEDVIDFVMVPKGGNPLLAQRVASELGANLIIAKDINDSARPQGGKEIERLSGIKYEGLNILRAKQSKEKFKGVLIDCNTSGGTQLVNIATDFNNLVESCDLPIECIHNCYVLFKLVKIEKKSKKEVDIDKRFADIKCKLYRIFDLDEEDKKELYNISHEDYYAAYASGELEELRSKIKSKSRYYYNK